MLEGREALKSILSFSTNTLANRWRQAAFEHSPYTATATSTHCPASPFALGGGSRILPLELACSEIPNPQLTPGGGTVGFGTDHRCLCAASRSKGRLELPAAPQSVPSAVLPSTCSDQTQTSPRPVQGDPHGAREQRAQTTSALLTQHSQKDLAMAAAATAAPPYGRRRASVLLLLLLSLALLAGSAGAAPAVTKKVTTPKNSPPPASEPRRYCGGGGCCTVQLLFLD